ncbi:hypothetical protein [Hymenobacter cavernae]|uniref:DUF1330 domain-containing protein n=1 Tax=Hymenobacter cavernae TaxID=2044852 RepID=A0ABQ1UXY8_9BACT|nr:hypothetical protein [Hymenobacter cavernae]GGF27974.1 hypothetical protein GCM10011383_44620 [Hymenobacter cavernae]
MLQAYKLLVCQRSTGHVLNSDAQTIFSGTEMPFLYFSSLQQAEAYAAGLLKKSSNLEIPIYEGETFLKQLNSS